MLSSGMPSPSEAAEHAVLERIAEQVGLYPWEAFDFVERGTVFTIQKIHGKAGIAAAAPRHVHGPELCRGLGEYAKTRWGYLACTVLQRWRINTTLDFGRIIFSMIEHNLMVSDEQDTLDDFRNVFDLRAELETAYRIGSAT